MEKLLPYCPTVMRIHHQMCYIQCVKRGANVVAEMYMKMIQQGNFEFDYQLLNSMPSDEFSEMIGQYNRIYERLYLPLN